MKNLLIALICFVSSNLIFAENTKNFPFLFDYQNKSNIKLTELSFDLNKKYSEYVFNSSSKNLIIESFPVSLDKFGTVKLKQLSPVFDVNTDWKTVKNLSAESFTPPVILTYEGTIEDEPDSRILLTYSNGCLFGSIQHSDGSAFSILPDLHSGEIVQKHNFSTGELTAGNSPYLCFTAEPQIHIPDSYQQQSKSYETQLAPSKLLEVKIACEATSEFYDLFANLDKATAYIVSVIANTSKIYEENLNVRMKISYFLIWQNSAVDPYRSENLLSDKLWLMPTLWVNKPVDRAITVLFASLAAQQGGVSVAGIAMGGQPGRGNLCSNEDGYCVLGIKGGVLFPTVNYNWDVNVAAHEIGHLFGSPHTHSCYWKPPIDTCVTESANSVYDACVKDGNPVPRPGTIMSYCHLTNESHSVQLFFHPREIPLMRQAAIKAACTYEVPVPYVSLLNPLGGKSYKSSDIIPIRWTSSNINKISLKYSVNNGETWNKIADYINTTDSIFYWQTPEITYPEVIVLIHSSIDMAVNDKSYVPFSISAPLLLLKNPIEGDEFPQFSDININWTSVFADSVRIQFSYDNGVTWETLAQTSFVNTYKWKTPEIVSRECFIKITSMDENNLISQSGKFGIGVPKATLLSPNGFEKLCVGQDYPITWTSEFVKICYLEYSIDNGLNWRKVTLIPLDAKLKKYVWTIPDKLSNETIVRISTKVVENIILDNSDNTFSIIDCSNSVNELKMNDIGIVISPNPVSNVLQLKVNTKKYPIGNLKIEIYNLKGEIKLSSNHKLESEMSDIQFDVNELSNGNYFLMIYIGDGFSASKFTIFR